MMRLIRKKWVLISSVVIVLIAAVVIGGNPHQWKQQQG